MDIRQLTTTSNKIITESTSELLSLCTTELN